ncbi:uncharacterized protein H6S33_004943 [Morchella sextelata]|uniref:uncharacterized protein n=1 Tax=Morchella sextelata TaxID=1174677 RepID=UPI001D059520|nr:uncharacterized protein H6S33_004943 [Morchella sextelata]KAH0604961.1 hypothetical protein H6S33_004943 [Morchella sextelata]
MPPKSQTLCKCTFTATTTPAYAVTFSPGCAHCAACICVPYTAPPGTEDPWLEYHALNAKCRFCYPVDAAGRKRDRVRGLLARLKIGKGEGVREFVYDF